MSNISQLSAVPDVSFIGGNTLEQVQAQILQDYNDKYQEITGSGADLSDADPVRLVLLTFAQQMYQGLMYVDATGKKNLLKYSTGEALDNLASNRGLIRKAAQYATCTLQFSVQNVRSSATGIPAGTRVSNGAGVYFMTSAYAEIPIGSQSITVAAEAVESGSLHNGIPVGAINQMVDLVPYISAVTNTTATAGGADIESDDELTKRIFEYPSSYSTAGAEAAYIYWAEQFRSDVADVVAYSPSAGSVKVIFVLENGVMPSATDISAMVAWLSSTDKRPLTDTVTADAPTETTYNITLTYYIDSTRSADAASIQTSVSSAISEYKTWQRKIGRDINPSELIRRIMDAGAKRVALTAPAYAVIGSTGIAKIGTESVTYGGLEVG